MAVNTLPPRDLVQQLLRYNPITGEFTWRPRPREMFPRNQDFLTWNSRFADRAAGTFDAHGYRNVCINWTKFKSHRLAWLYVRGEPVPDEIDHIDRDHANNRIGNLRAASPTQNRANTAMPRIPKSGAKGVHIRGNRFRAHIKYNRKVVYLGTFDTVEEAAQAYQDAAVRLFGEFASWD